MTFIISLNYKVHTEYEGQTEVENNFVIFYATITLETSNIG